MKKQITTLFILMFVSFNLNAETIILRSGEQIDGNIIRTTKQSITIQLTNGMATYTSGELDPDWVDTYNGGILKIKQRARIDEVKGFAALFGGLFGSDSLAEASPFLEQYRTYVLPIAGIFILIGLLNCLFGWRLFKWSTIFGGMLSGIMMGLIFTVVLLVLCGEALRTIIPQDAIPFAALAGLLLIGIPFCYMGARYGRRFAMTDARTRTLDGVGSGWLGSICALTRFAYFDLSVIWSHALFGAALLVIGAYAASVPLFEIPDNALQQTFLLCAVTGIVFCIFGATSQIRHLRATPTTPYHCDY